MGLLDLPAPLFTWLDGLLAAGLATTARLVFWGATAGLVSMLLYKAVSPQARIADERRRIRQARRALDEFDGEFADAGPLISGLLRLALAQVGRVAWPAVLASLPLLALLVWLSTAYGHAYPGPGATPELAVSPSQLSASWVPGTRTAPPRVTVRGPDRSAVVDVPLAAPVPVLHKRRWWNALLGNPAGYLPDTAAVDSIRIGLPRITYLPVGPEWARGWELVFFGSLLVVSLLVKRAFRIE